MAIRLAPALAAVLACAAIPARAVDRFELQVYDADVRDPGQLGLEAHLNFSGRSAGAEPVARVTFEPSVGVTDWLELGAYLQLFGTAADGARFGGTKARAKLVVPARAGLPFLLGVNVEVARVPRAVEEERWSSEIRPIVGWQGGRWLVLANPISGYALSGPDRFRPDLEPCGKAAFDTRLGFSIGAEYYSGLGFADALLPLREQEHLLFAALDLVEPPRSPGAGSPVNAGPWELNVAVGTALTDAPGPRLLAKAIVGRSF